MWVMAHLLLQLLQEGEVSGVARPQALLILQER